MRNGSSSPSPLLWKAPGRVLLLQRLCLLVGSKTIEYLYSTAQIIDFVAVDESEEGMNHEKTTSSRGGATSVCATMNCSGRCCGDVLSWRFERGQLFLLLPKAVMWLSTAVDEGRLILRVTGVRRASGTCDHHHFLCLRYLRTCPARNPYGGLFPK
jgi:hypothetical protein